MQESSGDQPLKNGDTHRASNGQFLHGHNYGKGNRKSGRPPNDLRILIIRQVSPDKWAQIIETAAIQAAEGDDKARTWLADRVFGKVKDIIGGDGENPIIFVIERHTKGATNGSS